MRQSDGSLARRLDFGDSNTIASRTAGASGLLRLAPMRQGVRGPDRYKLLEHRRRQAQIRARRLLDLL